MRTMGLALCALTTLAFLPAAFADTITGKIIAYDRKAQVLVLEDRSIYSMKGYESPLLAELKAGDVVKIETMGEGEDGYGLVIGIEVQN